MRLRKPSENSSPLTSPWSWRSELGIWFTITAIIHFIIVLIRIPFSDLIKIGGAGFGLANLLGLIALFWALILTATSFNKIIMFLGIESWKWLHSLTYVVFYLVSTHFIYFQFFSTYGEVGPDWFGYMAVLFAIIIVVLQLITYVVTIYKTKEKFQTSGDSLKQ
jgi:sulfoxide reductase heme-binding subunit YedZ